MRENLTPRVGKAIIPRERPRPLRPLAGLRQQQHSVRLLCTRPSRRGDRGSADPLPGYETDSRRLSARLPARTRPKEKPFFAVLSVQPPHNPYLARRIQRRYQPQEIKLRPNVAHNPAVENRVRHDLAESTR
jgi:hypothetical protein